MKASRRRDLILILCGDILAMGVSLFLSIVFRSFGLPDWSVVFLHLTPFGFLIGMSLLVFYIIGLYEPQTVVLKGRLPSVLLNASIINALLGLILFYFFPFVGIAPKITLLLYLFLSFGLLLFWRLYGGRALGFRRKEPAILIGGGEEMEHLIRAVNTASFYGIEFVKTYNLDEALLFDVENDLKPFLRRTTVNTIVLDLSHPAIAPILSRLQEYQFQGVHFLDQSKVYEDIFDRVPLSLIGYAWILEHTSSRAHFGYDLLKRFTDIVFSFILILLTIVLYPPTALAIILGDRGRIFLFQERVGEKNKLFTIVKFRTMRTNDRGKWVIQNDPRITFVGKFLRTSRIDELPQLWNVLMGDLSLIGPRPELPDLVKYYNAVIPYYNVRHLVKPGLSGWAQVHHEKPPHSVEETREKLSYDLYYIKNRSFMLDLKIALKTVKTLFLRTGV